jgi:hypothetical protein
MFSRAIPFDHRAKLFPDVFDSRAFRLGVPTFHPRLVPCQAVKE